MAKKQHPNKTKKVKKNQLAKKAEIKKPDPAALITVKLPAQPAIHLLRRTVHPKPEIPLPVRVIRPQTVAFTDLPGEIRNKIYGYTFHHELYEISWADKAQSSLTYRLPQRPAHASPRLTPTACRRRRLFDYPRRIRSNEIIEPYQLSPGPASLLLTCKRVCEEASSLFYGISTFTFKNQGAFAAFLKTTGKRNLTSIRSLHLKHHTAGNPFLSQFQSWKHVYDNKWEELCYQAAQEMTCLEELSIDLTINDVPIVFDDQEPWMAPLLWFEDTGLKKCSLKLRNHAAPETVLEVETWKLRKMLLGDEYLEGMAGEFCYSRSPERIIREGPMVLNIRTC